MMNDENIAKLENKIYNLKAELGIVDSRIDTLSCYRGNESELDDLYEQSNILEDEIKELEKQLEELKKKQTRIKR